MVPDYKIQSKAFFDIKNPKYNFEKPEDCGKYTEEFVVYFREFAVHEDKNGNKIVGDKNIFHLRKYGNRTQYNGHAIDAILYYDTERGTYQSIDLIGAAEGPDVNTSGTWTVQQVYYEAKDAYLLSDVIVPPVPVVPMVPYVSYNESGNQRVKRVLEHDYARRPQGADFDVSVWAGRYFHNCYMGPEGKPLGEQGALERIKPELCAALGITVTCDGVKCSHPVGTVYLG